MTYDEFINNILQTRGRFSCGTSYHERHHIIPKCCGGSNNEENLIDLYAKEHFIAHKLLALENPENINLIRAYNIMAFTKNDSEERYELTPEEYEEVKQTYSKALKEFYKDKTNHPCYGKHISEERKQLISNINKGNKYCLGRVLSEETKRKIGDANRNPSSEKRKKMSDAQKALKRWAGDKNPKARAVVRLSDGKKYNTMIEGAKDNNINYGTFKDWVHKNKGYMYYDLWLNSNEEK